MNFSKDSFLKLAGTAILLSLVILTQPIPAQAALISFTVPQMPFETDSQVEQQALQQQCEAKTDATQTATWDSTTEYCAISLILCPNEYYRGVDGNCYPEGSITNEVAAVATTTPTATDRQSEIVTLLRQLIALETQLLQLQNGQTK
jgi:hypothetical protein